MRAYIALLLALLCGDVLFAHPKKETVLDLPELPLLNSAESFPLFPIVSIQRVGAFDFQGYASGTVGNPPTGYGRVSYNTTTSQLNCSNSDGSSCLGSSTPGSPGSLTGLIDAGSTTYGGVSQFRSFNDGVTSSGQNTLTSATLNCNTADNGKVVIVVQPSNHVYPFGTGNVTQTGCTSSTVATLSANATLNGSSLDWAIGAEAGPQFQAAANAAWTTNQAVSLPCGGYIVGSTGVRPFVFSTPQIFTQNYYLQGCQGGNGRTTLLLHPQITSSITSTGGFILYGPTQTFIGFANQGISGQSGVKGITVTTLQGALPGGAGQSFSFLGNFGFLDDVMFNSFGMSAGSCVAVQPQSGEVRIRLLNVQNSDSTYGASCSMMTALAGQGTNVIQQSICAFLNGPCISLNGPVLVELINDYFVNVGGAGAGAINTGLGSGNILNIIGGTYSVGSTTNPVIRDTTGATINISGGAQINQPTANSSAISMSGATLTISQSKVSAATAGFSITGTGTVINNCGNNISSIGTGFTVAGPCGVPELILSNNASVAPTTICSNVTPVTVNTSTTSDQNLMSCTLPANLLNTATRILHIWTANVYSTPAASAATVNLKAKLCSVSGCGSGTVVTLASITSSANPGTVTNNSLNLTLDSTTQTAGASSAYEAHGNMTIDLGASPGLADSIFSDSNTATVGTIDSTAQMFLQITGAFSAASGSNSITARQLIVSTLN